MCTASSAVYITQVMIYNTIIASNLFFYLISLMICSCILWTHHASTTFLNYYMHSIASSSFFRTYEISCLSILFNVNFSEGASFSQETSDVEADGSRVPSPDILESNSSMESENMLGKQPCFVAFRVLECSTNGYRGDHLIQIIQWSTVRRFRLYNSWLVHFLYHLQSWYQLAY